ARKHPGRWGHDQWSQASMGPRSCERGNSRIELRREFMASLLQWGRARVSAETPNLVRQRVASTELQWGRARVSAETFPTSVTDEFGVSASMGPRSCERGNLPQRNARA